MAKNYNTKRNRNTVRGDSPTIDKDKEYFQKKLSSNKNTDVRYWRNLKDLKEKISYPFACTRERCPAIKRRLDLHIRDHHSDNLSDTLSISPKPKTVRNSKRNSNSGNSTQTSNIRDQAEGTENVPLLNTQVSHETQTPYKLDLDKIIMKWIQHLPIYPYTSDKKVVDGAINSLINNINDLSNNIKNIDYEDNVKIQIDSFLNTPRMWSDFNEDGQDLIKESLRNYLWKSIKDINDKHFAINRGDTNISINNSKKNEENHLSYVYSQDNNWNLKLSTNECKPEIENEIRKWLNELKLTHKVNNSRLNKKETVQLFLTRLTGLLNQYKNTTDNKTGLKKEIIDILNELRIYSYYSKNGNIDIDQFAEGLTNKLVNIQTRYKSIKINESSNTEINKGNNVLTLNNTNEFRENNDLKHTLLEVVSECLEDDDICSDIVEDTTDIIINNLDCFKMKKYNFVKTQISNLLRSSCEVSVVEASNIAQQIVDIANEIVSQDDTVVPTIGLVRPCLSGVLSVYASADDSKLSSRPVTSTPKAKRSKAKKDIPKLNPEERSYRDKLINLVRAWTNSLPKQFHTPEDNDFKEIIIDELVGNILEEAKLAQLVPHAIADQRKFTSYFVLQWLQKFKICTDLDASTEQTNLLIEKIMTIPIPKLTRPQHGTRQQMENIKFEGNPKDSFKYFIPKATDVLEDEISIWMNEQPSNIYITDDKSIKGKMVQELAAKIRPPLANKRPHKEISQNVAQWLRKIVKPDQKNNVGQLSESLKDRIVKVPQEETLAKEKVKIKQKYDERKENQHGPAPPVHSATPVHPTSIEDTDKTLKEFIERYTEHNYDIDDPLARGAFTNLLKTEIIRLNPPTRKEVYDNFMKLGRRDYFSTEKLDKELQYIKIVTDWLKLLPLLPDSVVSNKFRVELINSFAKEIYEIEDRRIIAPDEMDHDAYLESIIIVHIFELPIDKDKITEELFLDIKDKIIATRQTNQPQPCCQDTKKIYRKEEIANFIDDYVQENSRVLNDDEVKMEACSARLLKEVKQIVQETADPEILSKEKVYENLNQVPVSGDESVRRFNLALDYAKEITEWMKNLPLLLITNQSETQEAIINMISALAEKMVERYCKKTINPTDTQVDDELVEFVNKWISELPLDEQKEIVYPIVISQLMNRMKKIDMKLQGEQTNLEKIQQKINTSINETINRPKTKPKASNPKAKNLPPGKTGECLLVDAIEQWCSSLPIKGEDDIQMKAIKDNVAKNLYQKVGELNSNPRTYNDDLLFQEIVADEIDIQLEHVLQGTELQNNKEKLKATLLEAVMEAKQITKETSAGDNYRHKLEKTIESSIPHPVQIQNHDPAFEIYKNRLAEEFILENFDHGNDAVKINYEKRIKNEIDKYFRSAQNRNAIPLSKDQMYNELYSSLFKVPIPNENSIIEEVEEVKTKCEIEKWFQQVPLRPAEETGELLERDKILSMLSKRIHEIEKNESEPDDKIHKEIMKWLLQMPLLPGEQRNADQFANNLQELLKSTTKSRKFVPMPYDEPLLQPKTDNKMVNKNRSYGMSQMEWPSRAGRKWISSSDVFGQSSCLGPPTPQEKSTAEVIHMIVKSWCDELPLRGYTIQEQVDVYNLIDDLKAKIILKVNELNSSPAILKDDIVYNELLNDALEVLLSTLPPNIELQETKDTRKAILIRGIEWARSLVVEEKARQEYKNELNETISEILGGPHDTTANMATMFNKIKEEIVENFVEYNYNKDDDEGKQAYKMLIHDAVLKYFSEIVSEWDNPSDILMKRNELICELSKIPIPNITTLKEEVEEIRMKNEVRDFFNQLSLPKESDEKMGQIDQVKSDLAKMLNDVEKGGHNCSNDNKMIEEITRCVKNLNIEVHPEVINAFVNKLKNDETERKAPPPRKDSQIGPCGAGQATVNRTCGQASGILQASGIPATVPLCARTPPPNNSRVSNAGVVLNSSAGQLYEAAQQIPVVADGSVHRSMLSTSIQPVQVPANEMVMPQISQPASCQQPASCLQPVSGAIPQVPPSGQLLSTVHTSSPGQRSGTAPTTGLYEGQPQDREPDRWPRDTRSRETRTGAWRQDGPRSRPSEEEDEECICESRRRPMNWRMRPPCYYYPRDYCEDCNDMRPPWWDKGRRKYPNDNKTKKDVEKCLKLLNIQATPEIINGYLNKLQSEQNERQASMLPTVPRNPDQAVQAIVNRTAPSYGQTSGELQACPMPVGPNSCQAAQTNVNRTVPSCCQTSGVPQASAMPMGTKSCQAAQTTINRAVPSCCQTSGVPQGSAMPVGPNSCQVAYANAPLFSRTTPTSNFRGYDRNNPGSGVVLSSSLGQLYSAVQQIPVAADGSVHRPILSTSVLQPAQVLENEIVLPQMQPIPFQQPIFQDSIQVPNKNQIAGNVPDNIPQVLPCDQLLNTDKTSSVGQRTHVPNSERERPREPRPGAWTQGRPRSYASSDEDDEDRYDARRRLKNRRNRPPCYFPRGYCDDYDNMPPWWGMPHPGLYY